MRSVPIPGKILRTNVVLGLTFDEIVLLASLPLVLVVPSIFVEAIPLVVTLGFTGLGALVVLLVTIRTPDGQSPLEWGPAMVKRRVTPDTYYLKPKEDGRERSYYLDVVHTAEAIRSDQPHVSDPREFSLVSEPAGPSDVDGEDST